MRETRYLSEAFQISIFTSSGSSRVGSLHTPLPENISNTLKWGFSLVLHTVFYWCQYVTFSFFYVFSCLGWFFFSFLKHDCCYTGTLSDWHQLLLCDQAFDQYFCTRFKSWLPLPPMHNLISISFSFSVRVFRCWDVGGGGLWVKQAHIVTLSTTFIQSNCTGSEQV